MPKLDFTSLSATLFEEFTFHLLIRLGFVFVNADWRKGTAHDSSPADSGRDIVCQQIREDVDGSKHIETWFVDCKHYRKGVPPGELQNLLTWAEAERPHTALLVTSGFLSNPAKDHLDKYRRNRNPPFRIKYWERPQLEQLASNKNTLCNELLGLIWETAQVFPDGQYFLTGFVGQPTRENSRRGQWRIAPAKLGT